SRRLARVHWNPGRSPTSSSSTAILSGSPKRSANARSAKPGWTGSVSSLRVPEEGRDRGPRHPYDRLGETAARKARNTLPHTFPSERTLFSKLFTEAQASKAAFVFGSYLPDVNRRPAGPRRGLRGAGREQRTSTAQSHGPSQSPHRRRRADLLERGNVGRRDGPAAGSIHSRYRRRADHARRRCPPGAGQPP